MLLDNYFIGTLDVPVNETLILLNKDDIVDVFIENFTTEPVDLTSASAPPLRTRLNVKTKTHSWLVKIPTSAEASEKQVEMLLSIITENIKVKLKIGQEPEKSLMIAYAKEGLMDSTGLAAATFRPNDVSYMLFEKATSRVINIGHIVSLPEDWEGSTCTMQLTVAFKDNRAMRSLYFDTPNEAAKDLPQLLSRLLFIPPVSMRFENALEQVGTTVENVYLLLCNRIG